MLGALIWAVAGAASQAAAQESVGYVTAVSGRVVALSSGTPILLNALDQVTDRTRLDVQANSDVQVGHHGTQRLYSLKGPSRALVSVGSITVEAGKPVEVSKSACAAPVVSNHHGGLVARGITGIEEVSLRRNFLGK